MGYVPLAGAAVGGLLWGLINATDNMELRRKLEPFERQHGPNGRFVSKHGSSAIEKFFKDQATPLTGREKVFAQKTSLRLEEKDGPVYTEWEGMNDGL